MPDESIPITFDINTQILKSTRNQKKEADVPLKQVRNLEHDHQTLLPHRGDEVAGISDQ